MAGGTIIGSNLVDAKEEEGEDADSGVQDGSDAPHVAQGLGENAGLLLLDVVRAGLEAGHSEEGCCKAEEDAAPREALNMVECAYALAGFISPM